MALYVFLPYYIIEIFHCDASTYFIILQLSRDCFVPSQTYRFARNLVGQCIKSQYNHNVTKYTYEGIQIESCMISSLMQNKFRVIMGYDVANTITIHTNQMMQATLLMKCRLYLFWYSAFLSHPKASKIKQMREFSQHRTLAM